MPFMFSFAPNISTCLLKILEMCLNLESWLQKCARKKLRTLSPGLYILKILLIGCTHVFSCCIVHCQDQLTKEIEDKKQCSENWKNFIVSSLQQLVKTQICLCLCLFAMSGTSRNTPTYTV